MKIAITKLYEQIYRLRISKEFNNPKLSYLTIYVIRIFPQKKIFMAKYMDTPSLFFD